MYERKKTYDAKYVDSNAVSIAQELLYCNSSTTFAVSRNFIEKEKKNGIKLKDNKKKKPVIYTSTSPRMLYIPGDWCLTDDNEIFLRKARDYNAILVHAEISLIDGIENNEPISGKYIDIKEYAKESKKI